MTLDEFHALERLINASAQLIAHPTYDNAMNHQRIREEAKGILCATPQAITTELHLSKNK